MFGKKKLKAEIERLNKYIGYLEHTLKSTRQKWLNEETRRKSYSEIIDNQSKQLRLAKKRVSMCKEILDEAWKDMTIPVKDWGVVRSELEEEVRRAVFSDNILSVEREDKLNCNGDIAESKWTIIIGANS